MSVPITLNNVANLQSTTTAQNTINSNNTAIVTAFNSTYNVAGDTLLGTLNANNQQIINLPAPATLDSPVRLVDVTSTSVSLTVPPTGTSGTVVGFLNGNNTFSGLDTFTGGLNSTTSNLGTASATTMAISGGLTVSSLVVTSPSVATSVITFPTTTGSSGQVLTASGSSTSPLTWSSSGGGTVSGVPSPMVRMTYNVNSAIWQVYEPNGNLLSISGSTTDGLQEAINYAQTNGYALSVAGPATTTAGSNPAVIECTTPVTVNPINNWFWEVKGAIIDFPVSASMTNKTCVTLGTMSFCTIDLDCTIQAGCNMGTGGILQVVHNGFSNPGSGPFVQDNWIHVRTLVAYGPSATGQYCVALNGSSYSVQNNHFFFEIVDSGGFMSQGLLVVTPAGADSGFVQNIVDLTLCVDAKQNELLVGSGSTIEPLGANVWHIGGLTPSQPGMQYGLQSFAQMDTYYIGSISINTGSVTNGLGFGAGSVGNQAYIGQCEQGVTDSGTNNTWAVMGFSTASSGTFNYGAPTIQFPNVSTTGSGANVTFGASNSILKSTSSKKYKTNIQPMDLNESRKILDANPITFNSTTRADDPTKEFPGLVAEEMHDILPQYVNYDKGEPDGIAYDRLVVPLIQVIKDQESRIKALESK